MFFESATERALVKQKKPELVENKLIHILPNKYIKKAHNLILLHGRNICKAQNPLCKKCIINKICLYKKKNE